ncbi:MAG: plasmid pRiA4b ORF-3 family protein [Desulfitobacteriaceae bacterium]|nr:plasmid pRiA4b ORF-3 family protein [Desulfitobacteriaceae bacterium]MDD3945104.1 plasmid pRiA4b ORF-3 family protein [Bacteroidales bacterium]
MKEYIDFTLSDWLYQAHIMEVIEHKTFLEDGPIVLKRIDNEDYMQIPLFRQVAFLCQTVREAKTLKLTTTGNLPRAVVQGIYKLGIPDHYFEENIARLRTENSWYTVPLTRLLAEMGGLIKKRNNALILTKEGEKVLKDRHLLLKSILITFGHKLNWAYFDLYEDRSLGQRNFGLSLLLMADYGNQPREARFYSERYFYSNSHGSSSKYAQYCYNTRTLDRFMQNLGLITYDRKHRFGEQEQTTVAKTPLFDKLIAIDRNFGKISYRAQAVAEAVPQAVVPLYRLRISLNGAQPAIWREFVVPSDISLVNFHVVIQAVMGWTNSHLHLFRKEGVEYTFRYQSDNYWDEEEYVDYAGMKIADLMTDCGDSVTYLYDYGDDWKHTIELLEVIKNIKVRTGTFFLQCLAGERRCPPEDCGGAHGYHEMLKILKNPAHSEYNDTVTWLGDDFDPNYFNLLEVNNILASYCKE